MKAMILAAGRGERMRPLTDVLPKPLLTVAGKPLIVYHLEKLSALGIQEVVINIAYLGDKIRHALGDGSDWGLSIVYSEEPEPLETAGALLHALPLLGEEPFLLINGDVWTDMDFSILANAPLHSAVACLFFVSNPIHHSRGDYSLSSDSRVNNTSSDTQYTFSGLALIDPSMMTLYPHKKHKFPLREVFDFYIERQQLAGQYYQGEWCDVGTPERLAEVEQSIAHH
jgi:MurNAc alpha-1-phosphate uridylyltransferase